MEWGGKPLGEIRVRRLETAAAVELSVSHTLPEGADMLLHWGVVTGGHSPAWTSPDPALWPFTPSGAHAITMPAGGYAVESTFPAAESECELRPSGRELHLRFPKLASSAAAAVAPSAAPAALPAPAAATLSPPPPSLPDEVRFVVLRRDPARGNMWLKQKCAASPPCSARPLL